MFESIERKLNNMCDEIINVPVQTINLADDLSKFNDRLSAMGKFIAQNNKDIVDKLELLTVQDTPNFHQDTVMSSAEQDQLFDALSRAKANIKPDFEKTGSSSRGSSATLPDMVFHTGPALYAEGLEIIQEPIEKGKCDYLKTTITHKSGQWRSSICAIRPDYAKGGNSSLQAYGAALTSMKRYVYGAILNLHTGGDKE